MHRKEVFINDKLAPSVTEVLAWPPKPWLQRWRDKWGVLAERKTRIACEIGNEFDDRMESVLWGLHRIEQPKYKRVIKMLENVMRVFVDPFVFRPEVTQFHVVSEAYIYHGTLDSIGLVKGKDGFVIVDWKTSNSIYDDYELQISAYAKAYEEETGIHIKYGFIVRVSKDKPHHIVEIREVLLTKRLFNKFLKRLKKFNERNTDECLQTH